MRRISKFTMHVVAAYPGILGVPPTPPEGYFYLTDDEGAYLLDDDGAYLLGSVYD